MRRSRTPASRVAQAFKQVGTPDADAFAVIVNHFKSKGSGNPDPDGQGNANDQRVAQANGLRDVRRRVQDGRGITRVFLAGDFNAYSEEDPIQVLNAAGYTNLESTSDPDEETYNFDGMVGSLDHVLANEAALEDVNARRHLGHQRVGVGLLRVLPLQLQRHQPLRRQPVPVLGPQPGDRRASTRRRTHRRPPTCRSSAATTTTAAWPRVRVSRRTSRLLARRTRTPSSRPRVTSWVPRRSSPSSSTTSRPST